MNACTIVARNYLPQARVLVQSFRKFHPEGTFTVLVIDDRDVSDVSVDGATRILGVSDIGISVADLDYMTTVYDVIELATAVKPWLLRTILEGNDHAIYFDPDIQIFRPIDEMADLAREHSIVLTPHIIDPMPRDMLIPSEQYILLAGVYNLGYLAIGNTAEAHRFLDWWCERLGRDCYVEPEKGFFVDQRFADFVPSLFQHYIQRDPSWNVAYWNLGTRAVVRTSEGGFAVDGEPLCFFHFSGYSPNEPWLLSKHQAQDPRMLLSESPALTELCDAYGALLRQNGYGTEDGGIAPYSRLADGTPIDTRMRQLFREALDPRFSEGKPVGLSDAMPPDLTNVSEVWHWLEEPRVRRGKVTSLGRYLDHLWCRRVDLQLIYPEVEKGDIDRFINWCVEYGINEESIPARLVIREKERRGGVVPAEQNDALEVNSPAGDERLSTKARRGVEVVGFFNAELGIAEAARNMVQAIEVAEIPVTTRNWYRTMSRQNHAWQDRVAPGDVSLDTLILCINADMLPEFVAEVGQQVLEDRYVIGVWYWEVSTFPESMHQAFDYVDEVWVATQFVADAISACTGKPVKVIPAPLALGPADTMEVENAAPQDPPTFLFVFDFLSVMQRKNPESLIEAFTEAFAENEGPRLLIKTINGDRMPCDLEKLLYLTAERSDIEVRDGYLDAADRDALMAGCACYVSLHRSEGLGLTMAEAMLHGKPVIATSYSGNMEFMNEDNSLLVDYELVQVGKKCGTYPAEAQWADPDVSQAAGLMKRVAAEPEWAAQIGAAGRESLRQGFDLANTGMSIRERWLELPEIIAEARRVAAERDQTAGHSDRETPIDRIDRYHSEGLLVADKGDGSSQNAATLWKRLVLRFMKPYILRQRVLEQAHRDSVFESQVRIDEFQLRINEMQDEIRSNRKVIEALKLESADARQQAERSCAMAELAANKSVLTARLATLAGLSSSDQYNDDSDVVTVLPVVGEAADSVAKSLNGSHPDSKPESAKHKVAGRH